MSTLFFFDMKTVCLLFGMLALMLCNILLGTALGALAGAFDWRKVFTGIVKALIVAVVLALLYAVGYYNAEVITLEMGGESVNLTAAVYIVALAAACTYAMQIITKLKTMLTGGLDEIEAAEGVLDLDEIIKTELEHIKAEQTANAVGEGAGDNEAAH